MSDSKTTPITPLFSEVTFDPYVEGILKALEQPKEWGYRIDIADPMQLSVVPKQAAEVIRRLGEQITELMK